MNYWLRYSYVHPGSFFYLILFSLARSLYKIGLLKPNTTFHYIERAEAILLLTPLAGSSSISIHEVNVKAISVKNIQDISGKKIYVLSRPYQDRMQSFYNKKIRNPTNIAKILLLASCDTLTYKSTTEDFNRFLKHTLHRFDKDKHLYTLKQILEQLSLKSSEVHQLDIKKDISILENLLGFSLDKRIRSTAEVAIFADPVKFLLDASTSKLADE